jgi:ATP-dependent helicase HrpB
VLIQAASERLSSVVPPADSPTGQLLTRIRCLRGWVPELNLPAWTEAELRELLPQLCQGQRSLAAVRNGPWLSMIRNRLTHDQWQALEQDAPAELTVPSGRCVAITYEEGRPPVLAVRIQELFGLRETPRIARGRVKVLLHLLAPNNRPQQVTDDLVSFWKNGYPIVRKELRARYPRHSWPDDPQTAAATRGPKKPV